MPNKYNTGGKVSGTGGQSWGGTSVDKSAAAMGTTYHNPNTKDDAAPGGYGSKGTASKSTPSKKG